MAREREPIGVGYSPARPLLHLARGALLQHGWTVQELWWQVPDDFSQFTVNDRIAWVERQVTQAIDAGAGACRLLVDKPWAHSPTTSQPIGTSRQPGSLPS
jgi:hypothetical protein